jgi:hypothetical protein
VLGRGVRDCGEAFIEAGCGVWSFLAAKSERIAAIGTGDWVNVKT